MIEIWRAVVGYEGLYEVSTWGRVKRLAGEGCRQERILKPRKGGKSYLKVNLCKDGKNKSFYVHRLVGMAFSDMVSWDEDAKGRPFEELTINHLNEDKSVNFTSNLQWISLEGNLKYGTRNERIAKAKRGVCNTKKSKPVVQYTLDGELVKIWPSAAEVQRQTGWHQSEISACCLGKIKSAYGYRWKFV